MPMLCIYENEYAGIFEKHEIAHLAIHNIEANRTAAGSAAAHTQGTAPAG